MLQPRRYIVSNVIKCKSEGVIIVNKSVYGPTVGSHLGKPIFQTIESDGIKYSFQRMAECDGDGCPLQQLAANEVMFNPGLIYTKVS